ncbi:transposase [Rickettsia asembonensis]|nr:transposase [Rickettsia asembonensis]WCR57093.1 MAG: hypothetical protein PG979_001150 [Rickettsia asembonensis]
MINKEDFDYVFKILELQTNILNLKLQQVKLGYYRRNTTLKILDYNLLLLISQHSHNKSLSKVANDKRAKIGCKGGNKFWYGYKKHVSVDIQSGMINKVAVTPANVTDSKGFKHVMPHSGATYVDKAYCTKPVKDAATRKGVHLCAVKRNNMQDKNFDLDKYYTKIRAPFERVFSQDNKRVRYIGIVKNQFSEFMKAICFNLKRLTVLTDS